VFAQLQAEEDKNVFQNESPGIPFLSVCYKPQMIVIFRWLTVTVLPNNWKSASLPRTEMWQHLTFLPGWHFIAAPFKKANCPSAHIVWKSASLESNTQVVTSEVEPGGYLPL